MQPLSVMLFSRLLHDYKLPRHSIYARNRKTHLLQLGLTLGAASVKRQQPTSNGELTQTLDE
jgi:hypothetical protein